MNNWKRLLLIFLIALLPISGFSADVKITDLPLLASPSADDLIVVVDDPGGSPVTKKATIGSALSLSLGWYDSSAWASINAAVAAIGATQTTLVVSTAETLTANLTVPSTLSLVILKGGSIIKASTYTLTINGPFEAGFYQVFSGFAAGDVTFGAGAIKEVYPEWWGNNTTPGTTDMATEIQSAILALTKGDVKIGNNIYAIASGLSFDAKSNIRLKGNGVASQILASTATFNMITISSSSLDVEICNLYLKGASIATEGYMAIRVTSGSRIKIKRNKISDINIGVYLEDPDSNECEIEENNFVNIKGGTSGNGYAVYTVSQRNRIVNNLFNTVGRHDIYLSGYDGTKGPLNNVISGNISISNGVDAFSLYCLASDLAITGNVISNNIIISPVIGISLNGNVIGNSVIGNQIINATGVSIYGNGSTAAGTFPDKNIISKNIISTGATSGGDIRIYNASYNIISENQVYSTGDYGVLIGVNGSPSTMPSNNKIINNIAVGQSQYGFIITDANQTKVTFDKNTGTSVLSALTINALANSATPSVLGSDLWLTGGTTTITNFTDGYQGKIIKIISEHAITITDGTNIFLNGSANFIMAATDTLTLIQKADGKWYEIGRSDNT